MSTAFKCDDCGEVKEGWSALLVIFRGAAVGGDLHCDLCYECRKPFASLIKKVAAAEDITLIDGPPLDCHGR